ncbi:electron transfer flavoprotein subunit alpha/FixB family protein [Metallumcola ferriviriculae]|uniref:Electron transfer flavoprotein subunit alpha/FixB family protein n=1 Tax=Metallumcola ferriviriculae TaxID=3039180 RepID=A0AAU0USG8_9FIRM|nr:electron transfer flavoprotein subunit alpha/FixB family protein [Desulfitibacteraceae bacterium MK1]
MAIWVIAEQRDGELKKVSLEMLSKGQELAEELGTELEAVLIGDEIEGLADSLAAYGAAKVYVAEDEELGTYSSEGYSQVISELIEENEPDAVFFGHTAFGKDLAPRVAQKAGAGMVSDITAVEVEADQLVFTRPIYAGKAFTKSKVLSKPVVATFRPNVQDLGEAAETSANIETVDVDLADIRAKVKEVKQQSGGRVLLTEADIIVSGGRGMKGPENFDILEQMADVLGAAVGASRAAVDAGWREHQYQVGQTGKTVSPTLYIACGISGAIQHLAGMSSSKYIAAINKDEEANIFNMADYGIVNDLFKVVPVLTEEFKKVL